MTKLLVNPKIDGFSVQFGNNVAGVQLDGGGGRYRLDKIGAAHTIPVQWILTAQAYDYLQAFYRTEIDFGSLPFTIDLKAVDDSDLGTYTVRIIPGTFRLSGYRGEAFIVDATLEVTPATLSESNDQALISGGPGE